jgi:hypothetical protein
MIDPISSSGLATEHGRLYRLFSCDRNAKAASDLVVYDEDGLLGSWRLDGIGHAHDVLVSDGEILIASPATNAIYLINGRGAVETWWQANAAYDSWHLNCLLRVADRTYATAFGAFDSPYGWDRHLEKNTGVLVLLPSGEPIIRGLTQPHHPRRFDGMWVVCNSRKGELLGFNDQNIVVRKREFAGYTRGLATDQDHIYLGENLRRGHLGSKTNCARVAVLDRKTWTTLEVIPIPVPELYDIVLVSKSLLHGLMKTSWLDVLTLSSSPPSTEWRHSEPLSPFDMRIAIQIALPETVARNSTFSVRCKIVNLGSRSVRSTPPFAVEIGYSWWTSNGELVPHRPIRSDLPDEIAPGGLLDWEFLVAAPAESGYYRFGATLIQNGVNSFDRADARNAAYSAITIQ